MRILLALLLLFGAEARGESPRPGKPLRLLELDTMYFEAGRTWHLYDPYFNEVRFERDGFGYRTGDSGEYWTYGIAVGFDMTFLQYKDFQWYMKNRVEGNTTNKQFRRVAWLYDFGFAYKKIDVFWNHRSEHLLDQEHNTFYPLSDVLGVRLYFYGR